MKLRSHLIALVIASLLPVILFAGVMIYTSYQQQRATIEGGMVDTARALSLAVDREIVASIRTLQALATSEYLTSGDLGRFYRSAQDAIKSIPGSQSMALMDTSGQQIFNLRVPFGAKLPPAAVPDLIKKIIGTRNPAVSNLFHSPMTDTPLIVVGVPVIRHGQVQYVLELSTSPAFLVTLLLQQKFPSHWTGTIVDGSKIIIARTRQPDRFIGQSVTPRFAAETAGSEEGLFRGVTRDGIPVYTAFNRSQLSGWTVALGVPTAEVEAPLRRILAQMGVGGLLLLAGGTLLAAILGYRIARSVGRLSAGARALGESKTPRLEPSRIVELDQVRRELEIAAARRQQMEAALRQSEASLIAAQHLARVGSWTRDLATGVVTWSDEIFDIFGIQPQEVGPSYDAFLERIHPEDRTAVRAVADEAFKYCRPFTCEYHIIRPDGAVRIIHGRGSVVVGDAGKPTRLFGTAQDITESKQAEQELRKSSGQLRAFAAYLESVREQERTQIARELHDEIGQALTAIKLSLERSLHDSDDLTAGLEPALELTNELMGRVRDLSLDLRPAMLDDLGLLAALRWHLGRYQNQFKILVDFKNAGLEERRFAPAIETAAYRIVQEALTNVARHAGVDKVEVEVQADKDMLRIRIKDGGTGFAPDFVSRNATGGLSGMRERAVFLGGQLTIESSPGAGTLLITELPLSATFASAIHGANTWPSWEDER